MNESILGGTRYFQSIVEGDFILQILKKYRLFYYSEI